MKAPMIRAILRLLSSVALAVAVIMAVLDATRSVAASSLVFTPLGDSWTWASPASLLAMKTFLEQEVHPLLWDPVMTSLTGLPGWLVFCLLAFTVYAMGHTPPPADRAAV